MILLVPRRGELRNQPLMGCASCPNEYLARAAPTDYDL